MNAMGPMLGATAGLIGAGVLAGAAGLLFWLTRRGRASTHEVRLTEGFALGTPTVLTAALALALCAYHTAAFSLQSLGRDVLPTPLASGLWWVLPIGTAGVIGLSLWSDRIESKPGTEDPDRGQEH